MECDATVPSTLLTSEPGSALSWPDMKLREKKFVFEDARTAVLKREIRLRKSNCYATKSRARSRCSNPWSNAYRIWRRSDIHCRAIDNRHGAEEEEEAPGPDVIPNVTSRTKILAFLDMVRTAFQKCLDEGYFSGGWKGQKFMLLLKPVKPPLDPGSCRPICLLHTIEKNC